MKIGTKTALTLAGATGALGIWASCVERHLYTVRNYNLALLPAGSTPLRVLQLSDLHLAPWQERKIAWVRSLAELAPDIVVLTGDLLGHPQAIRSLIFALKPLAQTDAQLFFVHGSNDYYAPRLKNPARYLLEPSRKATREPDIDNALLTKLLTSDLGAADLNNRASATRVKNTNLEFYGLNDPHIKYHDYQALEQSVAELLSVKQQSPAVLRQGAAEPDAAVQQTATKQQSQQSAALSNSGNALRIGVVHAPYTEVLDYLTGADCSLILAGHTHGGQLRVPFVGALTSNSDLPLEFARGLHAWSTFTTHSEDLKTSMLNVSAGLGTSIYAPVRFCCRPEASLLTLTAAS